MHRESSDAPSVETSDVEELQQPLLIGIDRVAKMLDVSARTVRRLADGGLMPKARKVGALLRWTPSEIEEWIKRGCPKVRS